MEYVPAWDAAVAAAAADLGIAPHELQDRMNPIGGAHSAARRSCAQWQHGSLVSVGRYREGSGKHMSRLNRCALWGGVVVLPVMACSGPDDTDAAAAMDRLDSGTAQVAKKAASSASTDQIGIVQARIDDEDRTRFTLSRKVDGQAGSTAVYVQSGQLGMVNIDAFPEPAFSTTGIFQVKLLFGGNPAPGKSPAVVGPTPDSIRGRDLPFRRSLAYGSG